jgi:hypothetical protein
MMPPCLLLPPILLKKYRNYWGRWMMIARIRIASFRRNYLITKINIMGVDRTDYIIVGYKMNPEELKEKGINTWDDKYLPFIEGHPGVPYALINDGMSGEYAVFGKVIQRAEEWEGFKFQEITAADFATVSSFEAVALADKVVELFGAVYTHDNIPKPSMFVFSHFS